MTAKGVHVVFVRAEWEDGASAKALAKKYGTVENNVYGIVRGRIRGAYDSPRLARLRTHCKNGHERAAHGQLVLKGNKRQWICTVCRSTVHNENRRRTRAEMRAEGVPWDVINGRAKGA